MDDVILDFVVNGYQGYWLMSFLFFDQISSGFGVSFFGNDLLMGLFVFMAFNFLFFKAKVPAFLVVFLNIPLIGGYAVTQGVFPGYLYSVVIMMGAVVLGIMLLRIFKD